MIILCQKYIVSYIRIVTRHKMLVLTDVVDHEYNIIMATGIVV